MTLFAMEINEHILPVREKKKSHRHAFDFNHVTVNNSYLHMKSQHSHMQKYNAFMLWTCNGNPDFIELQFGTSIRMDSMLAAYSMASINYAKAENQKTNEMRCVQQVLLQTSKWHFLFARCKYTEAPIICSFQVVLKTWIKNNVLYLSRINFWQMAVFVHFSDYYWFKDYACRQKAQDIDKEMT